MANKQAPGNDAAASPRRVLLAGASGLVGRELLAQCLSDGDVVHAVVRRAPESASRDAATQNRIHWHVVDFNALPKLPRCDVAFCALGTTIKTAGSQAAFRAVDFDAVLAFARAARRAGVARLGVVSALGANAASSNFYSRVKGETEAALGELGFASIVFARPSLLTGDRQSLGQPARHLEALALRLSTPLALLVPAPWRPIAAARVARALRLALRDAGAGTHVLGSGQMRSLRA